EERFNVSIVSCWSLITNGVRWPWVAHAGQEVTGCWIDHHRGGPAARRAARVAGDDCGGARLQPGIDGQLQFAMRVHRRFHGRIVRVEAMAKYRDKVAIVPPQRRGLRTFTVQYRDDRLMIVEPPQRRFAVALNERRIRRAPVAP